MNATLSRSERQDLLQLVRARERVAKAAAAERAAHLRADFETQMDTKYSFDTSQVWTAAYETARAAAEAAELTVAAECEKMGIPQAFAPSITTSYWLSRGQNMVKERRTELRRLTSVHIEASEKTARAEIAHRSVEAQTAIIASGLSAAGLAFLEGLPSADAMMPALAVAELESLLPAGGRE